MSTCCVQDHGSGSLLEENDAARQDDPYADQGRLIEQDSLVQFGSPTCDVMPEICDMYGQAHSKAEWILGIMGSSA